MEIPNFKGRDASRDAYPARAQENRVPPDRSPLYVNLLKTFANFEQQKGKISPRHGELVFLEKNVIKKGEGRQDRRGFILASALFPSQKG